MYPGQVLLHNCSRHQIIVFLILSQLTAGQLQQEKRWLKHLMADFCHPKSSGGCTTISLISDVDIIL